MLWLRNAPPRGILSGGIPALVAGVAITLAGVQMRQVSLMLLGTVVAGIGFGAVFSGAMRSVMPHAEAHERADRCRPGIAVLHLGPAPVASTHLPLSARTSGKRANSAIKLASKGEVLSFLHTSASRTATFKSTTG